MKNRIQYIITIVVAGLCPVQLAVAQVNHYYTVKDGLSNSFIHHICQDAAGLIWVSTDDGLNCFDGETFKVYRNIPSDSASLVCNKVIQVFEDSRGKLWVSTLEGVMWFRRETASFRTAVPAFSGDKVACLAEDKSGNIWMAVHTKGVFCIDSEGHIFRQLNTENHDLDYVRAIYVDGKTGDIWMGVRGAGLFIYHTGEDRLECYNRKNTGLNGQWVNAITCDKSGRILAGTEQGINIFNDSTGKFSFTGLDTGAGLSNVYSLLCSDDNTLWVATDGSGLKTVNLDTRKTTAYEAKLDNFITSHSKIHAIFEDRQGNIWLGVYQKGLYRISDRGNEVDYYGLNTFFFGKGNNEHCALSILEDYKGDLWIGTDGGGLLHVDRQTGVSEHIRQFRYESVTALYEDNSRNLWMGTYHEGTWKFNSRTKSFEKQVFKDKNGQASGEEYVICFTGDPSGRLWIGTGGKGVIVFNPKTAQSSYMSIETPYGGVSLPNNYVNALESVNSEIWIGTYKGLLKYSINGASTLYTAENSHLSNDIIFSLRKDRRGGLWVGTLNGLNYIDQRGVMSPAVNIKELSSSNINGIEEDGNGHIWISSINNIIEYRPETQQVVDYGTYEPLLQGEYWWGAHYHGESGKLYFGGIKGVVSFRPPLSVRAACPLSLQFTTLSYIEGDNESEQISEYKLRYRNIGQERSVSINPRIRTFTVGFKAVTFRDRLSVKYKARLIGIDPHWQEIPGNNRQVTFSNLAPGKYVLEITAQTDGNEPLVNSMEIVVIPPWWRTTAAYIVYFFLLAALVYAGYVMIRRRIRLQQLKLQQANSRKLMQYKLDFFTEISHEIRTPLTLVISPLIKLIREEAGQAKAKTYELMMRNINRVVLLVNEMIDIRKVDSDQYVLCVEPVDVAAFTENIITYFRDVASLREVDMKFAVSALHSQTIWVDKACFEKIMFNLLSNAVKHSRESGTISVTLDYTAENLLIAVRNTGDPISETIREKIFERFVSGETNGKISSGMGLYLTRKFIEMHHGTIRVECGDNCTVFLTTIPYGYSHFTEEQLVRKYSTDSFGDSFIFRNSITFNNNRHTRHRLKSPDKVLVVDDEPETRKYVAQTLAASYLVLEAENGEAGMKIAVEQMPDIIICDVMMPGIDGITLCKSLKNQERTSRIPVILLTAKATSRDQVEIMQQSGADLFISKPFDIDYLLVCVKNLLHNREHSRKMDARQEKSDTTIVAGNDKLLSADERFIEKFKAIVEKELDNADLGVEFLSNALYVSRVHLHRRIKNALGVSPSEYIRVSRLHRAESVLSSSNLTISEVAYMVGFNSIGNFTIAFKKMFGVPPTYYREMRTGKMG